MKTDNKPLSELKRVREWAHEKIQGGNEPPWAWYQYMKLIEAVDAILDGLAATTENLQQSAEHQGTQLRLVASNDSRDTSRPRHVGCKVRMPM